MSKQKILVSSLKPFGVDIEGLDPNAVVERKGFVPVVKLVDGEERMITASISTSSIDADGDIVVPGGCDVSRYVKNPVVVWSHNYSEPCIGKALEIRATATSIEAKIQFADTPRAQEIWSLVKGNFLRCHSVGFITQGALHQGTSDFKAYCKEMGINDPKCKRIVTKWLLLEDSVVNIPSNPDALTQAISSKSINLSEKTIKELDLPKIEISTEIKTNDEVREKIRVKMVESGFGYMTEIELARLYKEKTGGDGYFEEEIMKFIDSMKKEKEDKSPVMPVSSEDQPNAPVIISTPQEDAATVNLTMSDAIMVSTMSDGAYFGAIGICSAGWVPDGGIKFDNIFNLADSTHEEIVEETVKPYPGEHAFRVNSPSKYRRFRRHNDAFGPGIDVIYGITNDGTAEVQAIRISKDKMSYEEAVRWVRDHHYKPTESSPATKAEQTLQTGSMVTEERSEPEAFVPSIINAASIPEIPETPKFIIIRDGDFELSDEERNLVKKDIEEEAELVRKALKRGRIV